MSPPKMPVTIAPPPGAMAPWPIGEAADAHLHTPMKKSRSDEKLSDVDLEEARHQFHQMLSRERPELSKRDKGRIVRSTINKKTADNLDAAAAIFRGRDRVRRASNARNLDLLQKQTTD